jgi:hypothetical protein
MSYSTYRRGPPAANSLQAKLGANLPARRYSTSFSDMTQKNQANAKIVTTKKEKTGGEILDSNRG